MPQLEKALAQKRRPNTAKNKLINPKFEKKTLERKKQIPYGNTYIWNLKKKKKGSEEPRGKTGIKTQTY